MVPAANTLGNQADVVAPCNEDGWVDISSATQETPSGSVVAEIQVRLERAACVGATAYVRLGSDASGHSGLGVVTATRVQADPEGGAIAVFDMREQGIPAADAAFVAVVLGAPPHP